MLALSEAGARGMAILQDAGPAIERRTVGDANLPWPPRGVVLELLTLLQFSTNLIIVPRCLICLAPIHQPTSCAESARPPPRNNPAPSWRGPPRTSTCNSPRCKNFHGSATHARTKERTSTRSAT